MNLRFLRKWFPSPTQTIEVLRRNSTKLRLSEWRSDPNLVNEAGRLMATETFKCMMDVVITESPPSFSLPFGTPMEDRAAAQCRGEGYMMALANFEAMGKGQRPHEPLMPTFEPEENGVQTA
jgi:hypothetical protein